MLMICFVDIDHITKSNFELILFIGKVNINRNNWNMKNLKNICITYQNYINIILDLWHMVC